MSLCRRVAPAVRCVHAADWEWSGIKPWDYTSTFIISSHRMEAHWWTVTSVFGRHRQNSQIHVGRDGEKDKTEKREEENEK